jgi:hypothetical protein
LTDVDPGVGRSQRLGPVRHHVLKQAGTPEFLARDKTISPYPYDANCIVSLAKCGVPDSRGDPNVSRNVEHHHCTLQPVGILRCQCNILESRRIYAVIREFDYRMRRDGLSYLFRRQSISMAVSGGFQGVNEVSVRSRKFLHPRSLRSFSSMNANIDCDLRGVVG